MFQHFLQTLNPISTRVRRETNWLTFLISVLAPALAPPVLRERFTDCLFALMRAHYVNISIIFFVSFFSFWIFFQIIFKIIVNFCLLLIWIINMKSKYHLYMKLNIISFIYEIYVIFYEIENNIVQFKYCNNSKL